MSLLPTLTIEPEATSPPRPLRMSYEEFLNLEHEGGLVEWVNGEVIFHAMPKLSHQRIVLFLAQLLGLFARMTQAGEVLIAPYIMRIIPDEKGREPDILFVAQENLKRITEKELQGPADIVVEVISEESVKRDQQEKFHEYQQGGVREYWMIDSRHENQHAQFYLLDEQRRYQPVALPTDGIYHSTVLHGFWLKTTWLWQNDPDPLAALAEIIGPERLVSRNDAC